ncbi:putative transmembrane amino acid transporter domain-containing protein [Neospora caninum Liverpool]|uniref:Putative transmembrane amino acid transporter domain-containing protein n=1 Tax=Neospora caninum (strain Liverpool) TaxID=572307 RepID=F0VLL0_NEOCL|nr:putative transmembrane amino acid transporter domain-containing protein [Neospora caninum Liverpool]CBZ54138.1 putative transmembrane amino acid transporter domain-containing protein [Neospora caninum Liverpool]CEL68837.1 TPA: transmembrane amino acid transporter domain-containing protein, putative [Neospora caninum Liverpool]|eukprot:XP_003884169.1 putative transmembrane amino acid transporter domain-containing protein [Neospora caninum Liverpool]
MEATAQRVGADMSTSGGTGFELKSMAFPLGKGGQTDATVSQGKTFFSNAEREPETTVVELVDIDLETGSCGENDGGSASGKYARYTTRSSTSGGTDDIFSEDGDTSSINGSTIETNISVLDEKKKTATASTAVVILKSFVGAGILFLPHAVMKGGLIFSLCLLVGIVGLAMYCMHLLIKCCEPGTAESYEELGDLALGSWGGLAIEFCVFVSQLGFCTINAAVVAGNLRDVIWSATQCSTDFHLSVKSLIWCGAIIYIPFSLIKHIKYLAPLMLVGNLSTVIGVALLMVCVGMEVGSNHGITDVDLVNTSNWPLVLGTSIYLWEGAGMVLPIRKSSKKAVQDNFSKLLIACLVALVTTYIVYSITCNLAFGRNLEVVILSNLPSGILGLSVQTIFAFAVLVTYPLMLFPASTIVEQRLLSIVNVSDRILNWLVGPSIRISLVILTLGLATAGLQQLDNVVALIGGVCGVPLSFIFPVLLHMKLRGDKHIALKLLHWFIVLGGFAIQVFSITWTIKSWHGVDDYPARCNGAL